MKQPIELRDVCLSIDGREILREISFSVDAGEFVGVIGANGAGKTTLMRLIVGLVRPTSGEVTVLGQRVRRGNRQIGYVPQRASIDPDLPLRARDFVSFGLDGERWGFALPSKRRDERIMSEICAVGAEHYADAPLGRLSGGEQQRLLIAQALLAEPNILLLDEPLNNLDVRSATEIVHLVDHLRKTRGVSVLFVTHDMNPLIEAMDRVIYLAAGRAASGTVDEVVTEAALSALYGYHVDVLRVGSRVIVLAGDQSDHHELRSA